MTRFVAEHDAPLVWSIHDTKVNPPQLVALLDWRQNENQNPSDQKVMAQRIATALNGYDDPPQSWL
jgi:hypothetical protein